MKSEVLRLLDKAIIDQPGDLVAERLKAQVLTLSGRRAEAMPLIESVLKVAPSYEQALDDCLAYALEGEDVQAAAEHAKRAVAINPWSASSGSPIGVAFTRRSAERLQSADWLGDEENDKTCPRPER
jgi:tetratricopeptide (TPR) repeat protein